MYRGRTLTLSFPPFTFWVKRIIIASVVIYFLQVLLGAFLPLGGRYFELYAGLVPGLVIHYGMIWQLLTYSFLHGSVGHVLINMLMLWMFGAQEEQDWGPKRFIEFYLFCVAGAGLVTIAVAYSPLPGVTPATTTLGASGGVYGILMAFGMLYGDREIIMFPLPFMMKAIGFLYIKFFPKRGLTLGMSERYFSLRNAYYRWKRRRAARKFEVYMREHNRTVEFDEHGNYIPPEDLNKKNGGSKSGWVN